METKTKIIVSLILALVLTISIVSALDFNPNGDIDLHGLWNIKNAVNVNATRFCLGVSCITSWATGGAYNATYDATTNDVSANRSAWFSTYNATYDRWAYNMTQPAISYIALNYWNSSVSYNKTEINANNASWSSTYNATYDAKVSAANDGIKLNALNITSPFWVNKTGDVLLGNLSVRNSTALNFGENGGNASIYWDGSKLIIKVN